MYDCRNPSKDYKTWTLNGEVENILWDKFNQSYFYVSFKCNYVTLGKFI